MNDHFSMLKLYTVPGIGQVKIDRLLRAFKTPEAVLRAAPDELCRVEGIEKKLAERIHTADDSAAVVQLEMAEKLGVSLYTVYDEEYPPLLKNIYDPPFLLFVRGNVQLLKTPCLAVVGMRACSQIGQQVADRFAAELAGAGVTVVSGMARGIDSYAHIGALKKGGPTVAVLGSGVDHVYPAENKRLYDKIVETGAVISELPLGTEPMGGFFARRNRIISGLSQGTLVVEAALKSGSLITAYMALEQGREVFAVPGSVQSIKSRGTHLLIRQGAKLVESVNDIFAELPGLRNSPEPSVQPGGAEPDLTLKEKAIWKQLSSEPLHIDAIARKSGTSVSEALAILLAMELNGFVNQFMGKMFTRQP